MPTEQQIRQKILEIAERRGSDKSLCPSEVARHLEPDEWRDLMPEVRRVAAILLAEGLIKVTQFGRDVDPLNPKGHIRISLAQSGDQQRPEEQ